MKRISHAFSLLSIQLQASAQAMHNLDEDLRSTEYNLGLLSRYDKLSKREPESWQSKGKKPKPRIM